ncbi:hypothetical protein ACFL1X_12275, partial [Candidatus Hydrogenedentota bacterium]
TVKDVELRLQPSDKFEGRVINTSGERVADALIFIGGVPHESKRQQESVARTGPEGTFSLDSLEPDTQIISAFHPDYAPWGTDITESTEIILPDTAYLAGTVICEDGDVSGVDIMAFSVENPYPSSWRTTPQSNGEYKFESLTPGTIHLQVMNREGRIVMRPILAESAQTTTVDFDLRRGTSTVEGRITVEGSTPESGDVQLFMTTENGKETYRATIDSEGFFKAENLPAGHSRMKVGVQSQDKVTMTRFVEFDLAERESVRKDVDVFGRGSLSGVVLGLEPDYKVRVYALSHTVSLPEQMTIPFMWELGRDTCGIAECVEDGTFEIIGLAPGYYTVLAIKAPQDDDMDLTMWRHASHLVTVEGTGTVSVEFDFQ